MSDSSYRRSWEYMLRRFMCGNVPQDERHQIATILLRMGHRTGWPMAADEMQRLEAAANDKKEPAHAR